MNTRTILLTFAFGLLGSAAFSQEKSAPAPVAAPAKSASANDELLQQKRQLSGELKNTLAVAEDLTRRANEMANSTTGTEHDAHAATAAGLKGISTQLTEQLTAVNRATAETSKGAFATAKEVLAASRTALDGHKKALIPAAAPSGK